MLYIYSYQPSLQLCPDSQGLSRSCFLLSLTPEQSCRHDTYIEQLQRKGFAEMTLSCFHCSKGPFWYSLIDFMPKTSLLKPKLWIPCPHFYSFSVSYYSSHRIIRVQQNNSVPNIVDFIYSCIYLLFLHRMLSCKWLDGLFLVQCLASGRLINEYAPCTWENIFLFLA